MTTSAVAIAGKAHANPLYGSYFADPFVWRHNDLYYAIGTGETEATGHPLGKVFPLLQSRDFFQWQFASSALTRPALELGTHFWAPAVACHEGKCYLYYSVGFGDRAHQLRVAVGETPQGPYLDSGPPLRDPRQWPFVIDPHPFQDDDGRWYLFYARDFLEPAGAYRAGTGLVVAPMTSMSSLGEETVILRAQHDWQLFQAGRNIHGRTLDWHTLEGPCVVKRHGRYYCFYSGGRWETESYGVDWAVAENVLGPYAEGSIGDGPRVLRTVPGQVLGPGHNTVVAGPEGDDYIVYHAWDKSMKARRLFIDRLDWTPDGPRCLGPTWGSNWP